MKDLVKNNVIAEMMAIANALHQALKLGLVQREDEVLLQTDCIPAIEAFEGTRVRLISEEHEVVKVLLSFKERFNLNLEFRHVKGHTSRNEARYVTNKMCDRRAKEAMRKARHSIRIQQLKDLVT